MKNCIRLASRRLDRVAARRAVRVGLTVQRRTQKTLKTPKTLKDQERLQLHSWVSRRTDLPAEMSIEALQSHIGLIRPIWPILPPLFGDGSRCVRIRDGRCTGALAQQASFMAFQSPFMSFMKCFSKSPSEIGRVHRSTLQKGNGEKGVFRVTPGTRLFDEDG